MRCWTRLGLPAVVLALGACSTPPTQITSGPGPSETSSTGEASTTAPTATTPGEGTVGGSQGGSGMDTTMGVDPTTTEDTTMGVDPTTSASSSDGTPPECMVDDQCGNNEICDGGTCVAACNPWGNGHYGYCLTPLGTFDSPTLCGEAGSCVYYGPPIQMTVCGLSCGSRCDCPGPPATGDATVTCGALAGGTRCFLSCANGETCPDGMMCVEGNYCSNPVQPLDMYGNCDAVAAPCADGGTCAQYNGYSVCISTCPNGAGECDPTPLGSMFGPLCDTAINPPPGNDCVIPCVDSGDCPQGMTCIDETGDLFCMWGP